MSSSSTKRDASERQKYRFLVDSNIFLEVRLGQKRAELCEKILREFHLGEREGMITDFSVDTIVVIMENYKKGWKEIRTFLSSLLGYKGLHIYFCTLLDRIEATRHMREFGLDFDDALTFQAMRVNGIRDMVSYDRDFDSIPGVKRKVPEEIL